eukprot:5034686-Amphidinium_carterae.1
MFPVNTESARAWTCEAVRGEDIPIPAEAMQNAPSEPWRALDGHEAPQLCPLNRAACACDRAADSMEGDLGGAPHCGQPCSQSTLHWQSSTSVS